MTVRELLEKTIFCDYLEITIRENGEGRFIYEYRVGEAAQNSKYDEIRIKNEWKRADKCATFSEPVEVRTPNGTNYLYKKIIPKKPEKAPKEILDLEISYFRPTYLHSMDNKWGIWATAYPKGWTAPEPERKPTEQLTLF